MQTGERLWEPELHRIEGETMLALSPADSAAGEAHLAEEMTPIKEYRFRCYQSFGKPPIWSPDYIRHQR